ncbi:MAG: MFS transporter, partial [Acidimicrobiia bacterium]|nr:MFS transporter [Acidimicrobiia bacterium]
MRHGSQTVLRVAIGIPVLLGALDLTVMSAVLPVIVEELSLPVPRGVRQAAWLVAGYLIAYAVGMLGAGRMADAFGERRVLFVALGVFAVGSGFVAGGGPWGAGTIRTTAYQAFELRISPDEALLWALILGRVVQALAAGAIVPVGMAFGWRRFGDRTWLGFVGAIDLVGWTFGHLYGGIIVRLADWRLAFWLNLPLVLLAAVLLARFGESTVSERGRFPIMRFGAVATGLALAVSGVGESAESLTASNPWLVASGAA